MIWIGESIQRHETLLWIRYFQEAGVILWVVFFNVFIYLAVSGSQLGQAGSSYWLMGSFAVGHLLLSSGGMWALEPADSVVEDAGSLDVVHGLSSCGKGLGGPQQFPDGPGTEAMSLALQFGLFNLWTTREVPFGWFLINLT